MPTVSNPSSQASQASFSAKCLWERHPERSGRTMARIGLRMMPPFPWSPLSFRTVSFPQSGWKAGISGSAFLHDRIYKRHTVCICPSCTSLPVTSNPVLSRGTRCACAPPCKRPSRFTLGALAPVRVMLSRSILAYWPHAPHSPAHLDFTDTAYTRCPRCASPRDV